MSDKPILMRLKYALGIGFAFFLGCFFFLAGLFFSWGTAISPLVKTVTSGDWQETPCKIVSSKVDVSKRSNRTHYRPIVQFEYKFDGQLHVADTYDFTTMNRFRSRCEEIVETHLVDAEAVCFVNPDAPKKAVIERRYDFSLFALLFPLIFVFLGAAMCLSLFFHDKESDSTSEANTTE